MGVPASVFELLPPKHEKNGALSKIDQLFGESSDSEEQTVGDISRASQLKRALSERQNCFRAHK